MNLTNIRSNQDLNERLKGDRKSYLLLYKKGSEISECAFNHMAELNDEFDDIDIYLADVNVVRDIHKQYSISTVPSLLIFEGNEYKKSIKGCSTRAYYKSLFESNLFAARPSDGKPQKSVTVYSTPTCSWCTTLKNHLNRNGIYYTDIDVSSDPIMAEELVRKSGQQGVPQTEIDGEIIVGFDKGRINRLLGIQG